MATTALPPRARLPITWHNGASGQQHMASNWRWNLYAIRKPTRSTPSLSPANWSSNWCRQEKPCWSIPIIWAIMGKHRPTSCLSATSSRAFLYFCDMHVRDDVAERQDVGRCFPIIAHMIGIDQQGSSCLHQLLDQLAGLGNSVECVGFLVAQWFQRQLDAMCCCPLAPLCQ